jgi:hypothetical protein
MISDTSGSRVGTGPWQQEPNSGGQLDDESRERAALQTTREQPL